MKLILSIVIIFIVFACTNNANNKNEFQKLLNQNGKWLSHNTDKDGNIEIIYSEQIKTESINIKDYIGHRYKSPATEFEEIRHFIEDKPAYYCEHKYNFNKKRELLSVKILYDSCQYVFH